MDNIVLAAKNDGLETAVLIDLQQSPNVYDWAPPEIYYIEWVAELGYEDLDRLNAVDQEISHNYSTLLERHLSSRDNPAAVHGPPEQYKNPPRGSYCPWLLSTPQEKEAREIHLLGKAMYCLFEGLEGASIILGRSTTNEREQLFPDFRRTPQPLRDLINWCTAEAMEWKDGTMEMTRRGRKVYPLGKTGMNGEEEAIFEKTKIAIKDFWQNEMCQAEAFLFAKGKYEKGEADRRGFGITRLLTAVKAGGYVADT